MKLSNRKKDQPFKRLLSDSNGYGALLQRDYWGVISNSRMRPSEVAEMVRRQFWDFSPSGTVEFRRADETHRPLEVGDEMEVRIKMAGRFFVRVLHRDSNSLTIGTLEGHPEAGRITFGAYPNPRGDVIFHIRSIARSSNATFYAGFRTLGEAMQTNAWTDFVNAVGNAAGDGIIGFIEASTRKLPSPGERTEEAEREGPTYVARGN